MRAGMQNARIVGLAVFLAGLGGVGSCGGTKTAYDALILEIRAEPGVFLDCTRAAVGFARQRTGTGTSRTPASVGPGTGLYSTQDYR